MHRTPTMTIAARTPGATAHLSGGAAGGARRPRQCAKRHESKAKSLNGILSDIKFAINTAVQGIIFKRSCSRIELRTLLHYGFTPTVKMKKPSLVRWTPPQTGLYLNVDGASKGNPGFSDGGGCIRDSKGCIRLGFAFFYGQGDSLTAETRTLYDGLRLADQHGLHISNVFSDSLVLVQELFAKVSSLKSSFRDGGIGLAVEDGELLGKGQDDAGYEFSQWFCSRSVEIAVVDKVLRQEVAYDEKLWIMCFITKLRLELSALSPSSSLSGKQVLVGDVFDIVEASTVWWWHVLGVWMARMRRLDHMKAPTGWHR
ncbi:hypothetical protein Taro_047623 [Colocasia esculenta]|uniref:RNase H type-1 domain-containing protein n=1 Tax=Colocasia esculenta TaxID=4460 RepID=A0A843X176_COLES|nr:hypothetical protein [Colocasia esculenta]